MRSNQHPSTPLLTLLRELGTADRRREFAALCGTSENYLYQLGICARRSCRAELAQRIAQASQSMSLIYGTTVVTAEDVLLMCQVPQEGV